MKWTGAAAAAADLLLVAAFELPRRGVDGAGAGLAMTADAVVVGHCLPTSKDYSR